MVFWFTICTRKIQNYKTYRAEYLKSHTRGSLRRICHYSYYSQKCCYWITSQALTAKNGSICSHRRQVPKILKYNYIKLMHSYLEIVYNFINTGTFGLHIDKRKGAQKKFMNLQAQDRRNYMTDFLSLFSLSQEKSFKQLKVIILD